MLKVAFTADGGKISLTLDGHAGQADIGHDIVCSACSILAYTVAHIVKYEAREGGMKADPVVEFESGKAVIICEPKDERYSEIYHAFHVAEVGYALLTHNYPQFVDLTVFGKEK
jgi:uncharacterized protein YsxB (DUF464 family)